MSTDEPIDAPEYLHLPSEQEEFCRLAELLNGRGMYDDTLDRDTLARYVQSHRLYLAFTEMLNLATQNGAAVSDQKRVQGMQDTAFKQCRACATDLGLTVSARAKLSIPKEEDESEFEL